MPLREVAESSLEIPESSLGTPRSLPRPAKTHGVHRTTMPQVTVVDDQFGTHSCWKVAVVRSRRPAAIIDQRHVARKLIGNSVKQHFNETCLSAPTGTVASTDEGSQACCALKS